MGKIKCTCNHLISLSDVPNQAEWLTISDAFYDKYTENIDAETLYKEMTHFLKCPECARLLFFWDGFDQPPTCYSKED